MMLRSSSTPVLGSLLSSFSESPSHHNHNHNSELSHPAIKHLPPTPNIIHQNHNKKLSSFYQVGGSLNCNFSCNSSPSISEFSAKTENGGFRRAQSEGNLEGLVNSSSNPDEYSLSIIPKKFARRSSGSVLETIPSFNAHNARNRYEDDDDSDEEEEETEETEENGGWFENSIRGEENSMAVRGRELNLEKQNMGLNDEMKFLNAYRSLSLGENNKDNYLSPETYLAIGLGVDNVNIGFGGGGSGGKHNIGGGGDGNGGTDVEEHYKRLVEENPGNPLFLRNYAQFLYESKGDLPRAEEYYSRAVLADSKDGEILSQYAKLVWELHHDKDTALSYFERAVQAAPENSHVQAAYANFLWEAEEDEEEEEDTPNAYGILPSHFNKTMALVTS